MTTEPLPGAPSGIALRGQAGGVPLGAILGGIALLATAGVGRLHLDRLPFTVCYFKAFTGWPCLTCGSTRALGRLFDLDLAGALAMNPLATIGLLALVPWAAADLLLMPAGRALRVELGPALARVARVAVVFAILADWGYLLMVGR
jgi:hypothetical protein